MYFAFLYISIPCTPTHTPHISPTHTYVSLPFTPSPWTFWSGLDGSCVCMLVLVCCHGTTRSHTLNNLPVFLSGAWLHCSVPHHFARLALLLCPFAAALPHCVLSTSLGTFHLALRFSLWQLWRSAHTAFSQLYTSFTTHTHLCLTLFVSFRWWDATTQATPLCACPSCRATHGCGVPASPRIYILPTHHGALHARFHIAYPHTWWFSLWHRTAGVYIRAAGVAWWSDRWWTSGGDPLYFALGGRRACVGVNALVPHRYARP